MSFPFVKGHGTHNDFVVLPDLDGAIHDDLGPELVRALCDRRGGIGGDGVLRVLRGDFADGAGWFMDYRNADGSAAQMCGNGVRVFARYLAAAGLVDVAALAGPLPIDTRGGVKLVTFCDDGEFSVDMGVVAVGGLVDVSVGGRWHAARSVDLGNPHAVAFVDSLDEAGGLATSPFYCAEEFPDGVNIEFVVPQGEAALAMRVFERGVGETMSCGTGACAAVVAARYDGVGQGGAAVGAAMAEGGGHMSGVSSATSGRSGCEGGPATYRVRVPGGVLTASVDERGHIHLKGPAVLVAEGTWTG